MHTACILHGVVYPGSAEVCSSMLDDDLEVDDDIPFENLDILMDLDDVLELDDVLLLSFLY